MTRLCRIDLDVLSLEVELLVLLGSSPLEDLIDLLLRDCVFELCLLVGKALLVLLLTEQGKTRFHFFS